MTDEKITPSQTTLLEQAAMWWLDVWELAGEKWPPENVALAWRLYERLKRKLVGRGASEYQAIALCDDFFHGAARLGQSRHRDQSPPADRCADRHAARCGYGAGHRRSVGGRYDLIDLGRGSFNANRIASRIGVRSIGISVPIESS